MSKPESASKYVKQQGLSSIQQMAKLCGRHHNTLDEWYASDPAFFDILLAGCLLKLGKNDEEPVSNHNITILCEECQHPMKLLIKRKSSE